jgi:hypothetical protein
LQVKPAFAVRKAKSCMVIKLESSTRDVSPIGKK